MNSIKHKTFLAVVATVLVAGTAFFASCEKENSKLSNGTNKESLDSKNDKESYKYLLENHDYSILIKNDKLIDKTTFGIFGTEIKGCREYLNGSLYEYLYIYSDEEIFSLNRIAENRIELTIDSLTSEKNKVTFEKIEQEGDTIRFILTHNNEFVANCVIKYPSEIGSFMKFLPYTNIESKAIPEEVLEFLKAIIESVMPSIVDSFKTSGEDIEMAKLCYHHMQEQQMSCLGSGGIPVEKHTRKHRRCSFKCDRN